MNRLIFKWNHRIAILTKRMSERNTAMARCANNCQMQDAAIYQSEATLLMAMIREIRTCIANLKKLKGVANAI